MRNPLPLVVGAGLLLASPAGAGVNPGEVIAARITEDVLERVAQTVPRGTPFTESIGWFLEISPDGGLMTYEGPDFVRYDLETAARSVLASVEFDSPEDIATWLDDIEWRQVLWETAAQAVADAHPGLPVHIVPGGLVLKRLQEQVLDGVLVLPGGATFRETFFKQNRPGRGGGCETLDWIHLSQAGIYAIALAREELLNVLLKLLILNFFQPWKDTQALIQKNVPKMRKKKLAIPYEI